MLNYDPHRWVDHLFDIRGSMVREIVPRVMAFTGWAVLVVGFHYWVKPVAISSTVHSLVGTALGLLLVFRTNSSYDRFWEGRKLWGSIVNETRNLVRSSEVHLQGFPEARAQIAFLARAFPYSVMSVLRKSYVPLPPFLAQADPKVVLPLWDSPHRGLEIARQISLTLQMSKRKGHLSDYVQIALDQNVQLLVDYLGACERIHRTPIPFAYMVHLRRALIFYCATLPMALIDVLGWGSVVGTLLVTYVFLGIEEIGVEIEDPFGEDANDLPLELICQNIERDVLGLTLNQPSLPELLNIPSWPK